MHGLQRYFILFYFTCAAGLTVAYPNK